MQAASVNKMYFIALVLPPELDKKVLVYKQWMRDKYQCTVSLKSPAHITLIAPFWMDVEKEKELLQHLQKISKEHAPFEISTFNFSSFAQRTLFIEVEENKLLHTLKEAIDNSFLNTDFSIKKEQRPFHPHITIATRDLHKKNFEEAWEHFKKKLFGEKFVASGIALLKHNGSSWDVKAIANFSGA